MINRFKGKGGRKILVEALLLHVPIQGDKEVAEKVAEAGKLVTYRVGETLIKQDGDDTDIYFILDGRVSISVSGRHVAERTGGQHVGEMALISPTGRRSATVTAAAETTVIRLKSGKFVKIADEYPIMWRLIAQELVQRFRQRGASIREPNAEPQIFIGSSVEGLPIAKAIQLGLSHTHALPDVWVDNVFKPSAGTMETLEKKAAEVDLAVLVMTDDDVASIRGKASPIARDNVIFELGLFMGAIGRPRTVFVIPRGVDLRIPSDLWGLTPITYKKNNDPKEMTARIAPVCTEIDNLIKSLGAR